MFVIIDIIIRWSEWEEDFWNNEKEFPNDNSDKSNARLRAFKMCCNFLDLIKK